MKASYFYLIGLFSIIIGALISFLPLVLLGLFLLLYSPFQSKKEDAIIKNEFDNKVKEVIVSQSLKDYYIGLKKGYSIGLKEDENKIIFISPTLQVKEINFKDIFEVKLKEDESTIISTSRSSQLGGAVVGGAIFGGIGALAGAMGGTQSTTKEIKKIELEIVVNDLINPVYNVIFLDEIVAIKNTEGLYKKSYESANHWCKLLSVIIKRNELNS